MDDEKESTEKFKMLLGIPKEAEPFTMTFTKNNSEIPENQRTVFVEDGKGFFEPISIEEYKKRSYEKLLKSLSKSLYDDYSNCFKSRMLNAKKRGETKESIEIIIKEFYDKELNRLEDVKFNDGAYSDLVGERQTELRKAFFEAYEKWETMPDEKTPQPEQAHETIENLQNQNKTKKTKSKLKNGLIILLISVCILLANIFLNIYRENKVIGIILYIFSTTGSILGILRFFGIDFKTIKQKFFEKK